MHFFCGTQDGILNVSNISLKVNFNSMDKTTDISQKKNYVPQKKVSHSVLVKD